MRKTAAFRRNETAAFFGAVRGMISVRPFCRLICAVTPFPFSIEDLFSIKSMRLTAANNVFCAHAFCRCGLRLIFVESLSLRRIENNKKIVVNDTVHDDDW